MKFTTTYRPRTKKRRLQNTGGKSSSMPNWQTMNARAVATAVAEPHA
jgi:hypothetical protein